MSKRRETVLSPFREEKSAIYHCVSRVVDRDFKFGEVEREVFVQMMRRYEKFCGVQVLSYCVMSNHFHILVKVPPECEREIDEAEIVARMKSVYSKGFVADVERKLKRHKKNHATKASRLEQEKFTNRMGDLSEFMKMLKWRFSCWFNKKHGRVGTLWESRFKSVLVEEGVAARTMAAYIDLNPVRAGMVSDSKEYRWCSYAEALAGGQLAQAGIAELMETYDEAKITKGMVAYDAGKTAGKKRADVGLKQAIRREENGFSTEKLGALSALELYRIVMFEDGEERLNEDGKVTRKGLTGEEVEKLLQGAGRLKKSEMLRCRVRYFTAGAVLGSKEFVNDVFEHSREYFGEKRKTGARKMRGVEEMEGEAIHVLRDLQKDVYDGWKD